MIIFNAQAAFFIAVDFTTFIIITGIVIGIILNIYYYIFVYIINLNSLIIIIHLTKLNLVNFNLFSLHFINHLL